MSDAYQIDGVTVAPTGGGWYEISHPSLPDVLKEQGKENADARAKAVAASLDLDDGSSLPPQPDLNNNIVQGAASIGQGNPDIEQVQDENAQLKAKLAEAEAERDRQANLHQEALRAAREGGSETRTIELNGEKEDVVVGRVPAGIPRKFEGPMDDKAKAALKKAGIEVTDIILEESESIPPTGLFLGHNGRGYQIVPGEKVTVPNFLLGVLDDAVMSSPQVDSKTQKVIGYRNRTKYPYRKV